MILLICILCAIKKISLFVYIPISTSIRSNTFNPSALGKHFYRILYLFSRHLYFVHYLRLCYLRILFYHSKDFLNTFFYFPYFLCFGSFFGPFFGSFFIIKIHQGQNKRISIRIELWLHWLCHQQRGFEAVHRRTGKLQNNADIPCSCSRKKRMPSKKYW